MRICPAIHPRADIDPGYFASPVPLPLTRPLAACLGRFNDPKRANYNPAYKWGDDVRRVGNKGNDFGVKGDITAMADGKVAHVARTDKNAAGV